jgi:hypothetical protein
MMATLDAVSRLRRWMPVPVRRAARRVLGARPWNHPRLRSRGVIEDLYYWVADGRLDTFLPVQNFFSVFFPDISTDTTGSVQLFDRHGRFLGAVPFAVPAHGLTTLRVSTMLSDLGVSDPAGYGSLLCDLRIPAAVLPALDDLAPFYFWDRSYVGYLSSTGQPCFVHGVDKTWIAHVDGRRSVFYAGRRRYSWQPEAPIEIERYRRLSVVLVNRTRRAADVMLGLLDSADVERIWSAQIAPFGVHRFDLDAASSRGLAPDGLRLRVAGMSTEWGRPVVFKEFPNGAISALHC